MKLKSIWNILSGLLLLSMLAGFILLPVNAPGQEFGLRTAQGGTSQLEMDAAGFTQQGDVWVSDPVIPTLSPAVRDLPPVEVEFYLDREINPRLQNSKFDPDFRSQGGLDPLLAVQAAAPQGNARAFDTPIVNIDGQGYTFVNPPDTVGDVGLDYYIQMINATEVAIYDKPNANLVTQFSLTSLGGCATGAGDPVVLYDRMADRWMLSEFGSGNSLCIFISQTDDPLGSYYSYQFTTPSFPDYPKYAVWPDAYYLTSNENSPAVYALDRAQMLAGAAATSQRFTAPELAGFSFQAMTPADLDGPLPPPADSPGYIMRHRDDEVHNPGSNNPTEDYLEIWEFDVDWATPGNSTFTQIANIPVTEFDSDLCGLVSFYCFPQPGSSTTLDPLREVIMFRLQYRNFGGYETLVGNLVTDVDGTDHGGIRWFELRKEGANYWSLYQEGTFAPDASHRWMGAIAMDGSGNIAVGYNVSDASSTYPSLRYVGRLHSDPVGTMPQGEYVLVNGTAANGSNRYGDYSAMSVDPADDCTFWFTGQYNEDSTWSTRIGAFKFDSCTGALGPDFTLAVEPGNQTICTPDDALYEVEVGQVEGFVDSVTLSVVGNPAGTTVDFSTNPVTPADPPATSLLTIGNTGAAAFGSYSLDLVGVAPTSTHTVTVGLDIYTAVPAQVTLVSPVDGATNVDLVPTFEWSGVTQGASYSLEVATDPGFSNVVYTATAEGPSHQMAGLALEPVTMYYWRVSAANACGTGSWSAAWSFTTADVPPILLVDDDDNSPDVRAYYTEVLDALGLEYDIWDTNNSDDEPDATELAPYEVVIWFTGDEFGGAAGPGSAGESALGSWLDSGKCLFLSSQDYYYDRGLTSFMQTYLGVASATSDSGDYTSVTGQGSVFSGYGPYTLDYPFTDYSDIVVPDGTAEVAFEGNNGNDAAVNKDGGSYQTTFWTYPYEAIPEQMYREDLLLVVLDYCGFEVASGALTGQVTEYASGDPIEAVEINVGGLLATTDASGVYSLTVPVGIYDAAASHPNYYPVTAADVAIYTDTVTVQDFVLAFNQQAGLELAPETSGQTGMPGETVSHNFTVENTGNYTDSYALSVSGQAWTTSVAATTGELAAGAMVTVTVNVTLPVDPPGRVVIASDAFTLTAVSDFDPGVSATAVGTTHANVEPGVTISPASQSGAGAAGEVVTYTFTISNTGDYTDTYALSVSGQAWATSLSAADTGTLGAGEAVAIEVGVSIPLNPVLRSVIASDSFTLEAVSGLDQDVAATATGTTQADIALGVAISPASQSGAGAAGAVVTYTFTISNTGDYTDTFALSAASAWTATLSAADTGDLGVGESVSVVLTVAIPAEAAVEASELATLTAVSGLDGDVRASATAETTVLLTDFKVNLPVILR